MMGWSAGPSLPPRPTSTAKDTTRGEHGRDGEARERAFRFRTTGVDPPRRFQFRGYPRDLPLPSTTVFHARGYQRTKTFLLIEEINRLKEKGVLRPINASRWVSRAFLEPKSGGWRLVIDLRTINKHCQKRSIKKETLRHLRLLAKPGDHWLSFDLKDGFYALTIHPKDREAFTINLNGQMLQLCEFPMGWSISPFFRN